MFASPQVEFKGNETVKMAHHGNDAGLLVEFHMEQILQTFLSEEKGEAIYENIPHVSITTLGKTKTTRPVKLKSDANGTSDPDRFPTQWRHFQDGTKQLAEGHPISALRLGNAEVRQLEMLNILTIERLASVPDANLEDIGMGARGLREAAVKWLASNTAEKQAVALLQAENAELKDKFQSLSDKMDALLAQSTEPAKNKPGPKPKDVQG